MKKVLVLLPFILFQIFAQAQTPVVMASQPALSYFESFDSISAWTNNFTSGAGTDNFASVSIGGSVAIPDPTKITTSSAVWTVGSAGGLQKDTLNGRLMMLVTGTSNNSNSLAFDLLFDFTGINAGTLSFDWQTVFNGAVNSNRTGTLKVYATNNGTSFTELTGASVTVTNYIAGSGGVTNIALPSSFDNSATARLRFYYYNSAGGSTGSRPLIALDNIKVTATGSACSTPLASPTSLNFTNVSATSVQGSFTTANPTPDEYLVVATPLGSLIADPVDSFAYNAGDPIADGTVIYRGSSTSFIATNLSPLTTYIFNIYPVNIYCNGVISYKITNPLTGQVTTPAGPPCVAPTSQPSALHFGASTTSTIAASFTGVQDASAYLVIASTTPSAGGIPLNGNIYNIGDTVGNGIVVYNGGTTSFVAAGLAHSTTYYFFVYALNNYACSNGPVYLASNPSTGQQSTKFIYPCNTPSGDASNLLFNNGTDYINGFFNPYPGETDGYLVVMSTSNALSALPQNTSTYSVGSSLGGGTVVASGANYSFTASNLAANSTYYFHVFSYNDVCIGGPLYRTSSYLSGAAATTDTPSYHFYFGNLHAHSSYSDGNKDSSNFTPFDDYNYAKNSLCMDFLGISEHNHYTSNDNPGMLLPYYQQGLTQAANFTAGNPGFLALYGMEWGTLTNGGHVVVYGVDSLLGWETINGSPNYDIYVTKNDYLSDSGLFKRVIEFAPTQAFATLAHPSWNDFGNIANMPWIARVDSAVVGAAIESGPAFSTTTDYTNPGSSLSFFPYYEHLLALGYHIAPSIDHDNHYTTFGRTAYTRTAVIAPSIAKPDFMQAMNQRRFYATEDCDTRAELFVYGQQMGEELTHSFAPAITVRAEDPTSSGAIPTIDLYSGTPGSGTDATLIKSISAHFLNYTDAALPDSTTGYYFAVITIAGNKTVTAPVWYTRLDTGIINSVQQLEIPGMNNVVLKGNPAHNTLSFDVVAQKAGSVQFVIYDMVGQRLILKKATVEKGIHTDSLPLIGLPGGIYILEAQFDQTKIVRRFSHY